MQVSSLCVEPEEIVDSAAAAERALAWLSGGTRYSLAPAEARGGSESAREEFTLLPSRKAPRWMLPVGDPAATLSGLRIYAPYQRKAQMLKGLLWAATHARLIRFAGERIVLQRPFPVDTLVYSLTGERQPVYAFSFGAPGPYCKFTIQVMRPNGESLGYMKVPLTIRAANRIRHEEVTLRRLARISSLQLSVPAVIESGRWQGSYLLFQGPMPGGPGRRAWTDSHLRFLSKLSRIDALERPGNSISRLVAGEWEVARHRFDPTWNLAVETTIDWATRRVDDCTIPCSLRHGDFAPWNTRGHEGELKVFDWEAAADREPAIWDEFHFRVQVICLLGRPHRAFLEENGRDRMRSALLGLYLVNSASRLVREGVWAQSDAIARRLALLVDLERVAQRS